MKNLYGEESKQYKDLICIYKIVNKINEKVYIGSTVNLKQRINKHINDLNCNIHINSDLQKEWNIYKSDSFYFEVIEVIKDKTLLPEKEKFHIDIHINSNTVYNKSDPTEEFIRGRFKKVKNTDKINKDGVEYSLTQKFIFEWLSEKFNNLILQMKTQINKRIFYDKEKVDKWIIDNIDNEEIKNDERILLLLHKWYSKNGFVVINPKSYKKELKDLYNITVNLEQEILVHTNTNKALYFARKKKIERLRH